MRITPASPIFVILPMPGPSTPIPINPGNGNGGIVPPWLQSDAAAGVNLLG